MEGKTITREQFNKGVVSVITNGKSEFSRATGDGDASSIIMKMMAALFAAELCAHLFGNRADEA